ncbi:uncharacterized protein BO80DRAFT_448587 [Aspergillus ibericus CBS 121593]|uniref:Uncharacterized protein n=1 Tax=Aspergillus ibericus CBS 121593 TaxID=1448316 RepID=A0A395GP25_9EURO|nr:hypothetical protein BO80DRAFT_448587 [Aspergillus ibericus CBS 121593]RAK97245.1 hypothetical protein BO80DRAFT_448587 [Aspergillus ibericus CBS 121593]
MSLAEHVSDPRFLQEFCLSDDLSRLTIDPKSVPYLRPARLALLHPLKEADILESCRRPKPHRPPARSPPTRSYNCDHYRHDFLDLQPLCQLWRQELTKIPPFHG